MIMEYRLGQRTQQSSMAAWCTSVGCLVIKTPRSRQSLQAVGLSHSLSSAKAVPSVQFGDGFAVAYVECHLSLSDNDRHGHEPLFDNVISVACALQDVTNTTIWGQAETSVRTFTIPRMMSATEACFEKSGDGGKRANKS